MFKEIDYFIVNMYKIFIQHKGGSKMFRFHLNVPPALKVVVHDMIYYKLFLKISLATPL